MMNGLRRPSEGMLATCEMTEAGSISGVVTNELPEGGPPVWITIFPKLGMISTRDGRSFQVDAGRLIRTFQEDGIAVPIDINHQTDTAMATGGRCDAIGWIEQLRVNAGKLEARVEWLDEGKTLINERRYRYTSPSFYHSPDRLATRLKAVALVTAPALANQIALASAGSPEEQHVQVERYRIKAAAAGRCLSFDEAHEEMFAASRLAAGHQDLDRLKMSDHDVRMKAAMERAADLSSKAKAYMAEFSWHNRGRGMSVCMADAVSHVEALDDWATAATLSQRGGGQARTSSLASEATAILTKAREKIREADAFGASLSLAEAVSLVEMEDKRVATLAVDGHTGSRGVAFEAMQLLSDARKRIQEVKAAGGSLSLADAITLTDTPPPEAFRLLSKAGAFMQASLRCGRAVNLADAVSAIE